MASWHQSTGQAEQQEMMKLQAEMLKMQQWETMKANIEELHMISTRCFSNCVHTFRTKDLEKKEKTCIENCATQFKTGYLQRIMRIFPEELQRMNQENLEKAQAQASGPME